MTNWTQRNGYRYIHLVQLVSDCRSQWPSGLRRVSTTYRLLGLRVRIPPRAWMFVFCVLCSKDKRHNEDRVIVQSTENKKKKIPPGAWMLVRCECCVLSGRGLCDGLITRPEESYRLCCVIVCDLETSRIRRLKLIKGCKCQIEKN